MRASVRMVLSAVRTMVPARALPGGVAYNAPNRVRTAHMGRIVRKNAAVRMEPNATTLAECAFVRLDLLEHYANKNVLSANMEINASKYANAKIKAFATRKLAGASVQPDGRVNFVLFRVKKIDGDRIVLNCATVSTVRHVMSKLGNVSALLDFSERDVKKHVLKENMAKIARRIAHVLE